MKMKSISVLCLLLLLCHTNFSLAKRGGGGFGKGSFGSKKTSTTSHRGTNTKPNQGSSSQGGYPRQPAQPNQGGYPQQPGGGYPKQPGGGYPQQPGGGYPQQPGGYPRQGYPNQYPAGGSPYGGGYGGHGGYGGQGSYGGHGGYGSQGGYGGYGGYPGGYINQNPNNKVLSPMYGGSFGYGGYNSRGGGSPFSHSVQGMGMYPKDSSRGFGRSAVMAAAGGAVAGMALGYGLGRFPRPHFQFQSPQEEYYYNHYMYRKYGTKSTDTNDYSRDYKYAKVPESYDGYMDSCMKRTDLLPVENRRPNKKPAAPTTTAVVNTAVVNATVVTSAPDTGIGNNTMASNNTVAENSSTSEPSNPPPLNQPEENPVTPAKQALAKTATGDDDDDDTVSIMEIGYPALIEQMKARRCLELYMVYSEKYLKRAIESGGAQRLEIGSQQLLAVVTGTILMLLNSNLLVLLH